MSEILFPSAEMREGRTTHVHGLCSVCHSAAPPMDEAMRTNIGEAVSPGIEA
jgi:hypothetical protein